MEVFLYMQITGNKGLGRNLKVLLQICFYGGIALLIVLPFILHLLGLHLNATAFVIYPNGIVLLAITHKFIKLFDSLKENKPFCEENVKILKSTGIISLVGAILWLIDLLFEIILVKSFDLEVIVILGFLFILFIGVSIALYILSELFREAAEYKKENELTI